MVVVVYGVASADEARALEAEGADVLGLFLGESRDGRLLDETSAVAVGRSVARAAVCLEFRTGSAVSSVVAERVGARWIQLPWRYNDPERVTGFGWVLGRVAADEDDDPAWVRSRWTEYGSPPPDWVHVEIFPDLADADAWPAFLETSAVEVDHTDLDRMAAERPIVFTAPLTVERVPIVRALLPHAHGFAITLAGVPGARTHPLPEALRLVAALCADH